MNRLDFAIEWYHKENERQTALNESLNIPVGILTGVFALYFYMVNEYGFELKNHTIITCVFVLLLIASMGFWLYVLFHLFLAYNNGFKGYTYQAIPYPTVINEQFETLTTFAEDNKDALEGDTAEDLFEVQFHEMLSGYLNVNIENNDKKSFHIHTAKTNLLRCIIFLILSFVPFSVSYFQHKQQLKAPEEIIIKNLGELKTFNQNNTMSEKPVKPTPPPPPPPRLVKEGKEPTPPPPPRRDKK